MRIHWANKIRKQATMSNIRGYDPPKGRILAVSVQDPYRVCSGKARYGCNNFIVYKKNHWWCYNCYSKNQEKRQGLGKTYSFRTDDE
jgi:hypothetical protein